MTYRPRNCRPVRRRQAGQLGTSCRSQPSRWDALSLTRLALLAYALMALTYFFAS